MVIVNMYLEDYVIPDLNYFKITYSFPFHFRNVAAGTELTWDYAYEVDSVKGKVLHCYCGSAECRGRLL